MRQERTVQASIFDLFATHEIGHELKAMSQWLNEHRDLLGLVAQRRRQGYLTTRTSRRSGAALRASQATPAAELLGVGIPSGGLSIIPGLWAPAVGMQPTEIGAAKDDQRDPARDLGTNQPSTAVERAAGGGWRTALSYGWTVR